MKRNLVKTNHAVIAVVSVHVKVVTAALASVHVTKAASVAAKAVRNASPGPMDIRAMRRVSRRTMPAAADSIPTERTATSIVRAARALRDRDPEASVRAVPASPVAVVRSTQHRPQERARVARVRAAATAARVAVETPADNAEASKRASSR